MKRTTTYLAITILLGTLAGILLAPSARGVAAASTPRAVRADDVTPPARVVLYGDSLSGEALGTFVNAVTARGRAELRTGVHGGTAICDWFDRMDTDAAWTPDAVVIEFSGNALTACMQGAVGDAYWTTYRADAEAAIAKFPGAHVYLVGTPLSRAAATRHDPDANRLNAMYAQLALGHENVEFVPAQRAVLLRNGSYTDVLPCLPDEPCRGSGSSPTMRVNVVRAPDGAHFCPEPPAPAVDGVTAACPVWSSGAYRFGTAMAEAVVTDLNL